MANVIFDFDGTIADTFGMSVKIYEDLVRGGKPVPAAEIERLRGMSMLQVALELRIHPWKVPLLLRKGRKRMHAEIASVQPFAGVPELIHQLLQDGHKLYIMSSNSVGNIRLFLHRHNLDHTFTRVYGNAGIFGKARVLNIVTKRNRLRKADTYYIGDEVRDIEASKKADIRVIAVTWGYNTEKVLRTHTPDFIAKTPADIRKLLQLKPNAE